MSKINYTDLNNTFLMFSNKMLMLRLINSGRSNLSKKQDVVVQEAFDLAHKLLCYAARMKNTYLFNRVCKSAKELVPGPHIKSVMGYPELYEKMVLAQKDFDEKTKVLFDKMTSVSGNMHQSR